MGTPNWLPPKFLRDAMIESVDAGNNQYCRGFGHEELVTKIAEVFGEKMGREINGMKEVIVT